VGRKKRGHLELERDEATARTLVALGKAVREGRRRRRLTQAQLAARVGLSQATVSRIERGEGDGVPIACWIGVGLALGLTPRFEFARDPLETTADAGHLAIQELLLRMGRSTGYAGTFELPITPVGPRHSVDVCLKHAQARRLVLLEAWNSITDIGAGARSFDRKLASAREVGGWLDGGSYEIRGAWVVRATRRNRELLARYPEVFEAKFPGSSLGWARALAGGTDPPVEPGLIWCDVDATRLFAWRRT
jgi:transcriptional regulator with XRE-family HTH domain